MRAVVLVVLVAAGCAGPGPRSSSKDPMDEEEEPPPPPRASGKEASPPAELPEAGAGPRPDAATSTPADGGGASASRDSAPAADGAVALQDGAAAPPAVDCKNGALVCDDFEDGDLVGWRKSETGGKLEVEGTHAYSGKSAVRLTIPANQRGGFLQQRGAPLFPLPKKVLWGRMMVYFEDMAGGHFDTIRGGTAGGGTPWYNIGGQGKAYFLNYYTGGHDCWSVPAGRPAIPRNKWMCWEWTFDGNTNGISYWVDGKLVREVKGPGDGCVSGGNAPWVAPTFGSIQLGEFNAQTTGAQTRMWMDDIALGTEMRIGCPAASSTAH
jgi:hypothetical protein